MGETQTFGVFCSPIICADLRGTAPMPLIPVSPIFGHTLGSFCIMAPPPEIHRRRRQIIGRLPSEGNTALLHCCWVTSVVFSSACSDWTYARHHLLCPLLTTMIAKSRSQTEWASPQRADHRYSLRWSSYVDSLTLRALSELPQAREKRGTPRLRPPQECGMKCYRSWDFFLFYLCSDQWGWGW